MSPKMPVLTSRKVIRALENAGFYFHHTTGSHYYYKHPLKSHIRVSIPYHNKDLKRGTLKSILNQAEMSMEKFLEYL